MINIKRRDAETQRKKNNERCSSKERRSWTSKIYLPLCLFGLMVLFFTACKNDPPTNQPKAITLPKTPEGVCRAWQQYVDNNEIAKAMLLGSPAAKEWLKLNQSLFLADDELEPTKFISIRCTETGDKAICKYSLKEEGDTIEDYFSLVKINQQWLIHIEEQDGNDPNEAIFKEMKKSLKLD